jgi:hypothetical protein
MKLVRWILIFIAVAVVTIGSIIWLNKEAFTTVFSNRSTIAKGSEFVPQTYSLAGLAGFAAAHPEWVGVTSYNPGVSPDSGLSSGADLPRIMGNLAGILVLPPAIERITEPVDIADVLVVSPASLAGREHEALKKAALNGQILPEQLFKLAYSDGNQTAQDFLILKTASTLRDRATGLSIDSMRMPRPWWGAYLKYKLSLAADPAAISEKRAAHRQFRDSIDAGVPVQLFIDFADELAFSETLPKASVRFLAARMEDLATGRYSDSAAAAKTLKLLNTFNKPKRDKRDFISYAALYDTRLGQLSGIDFGTSAYDSSTTFVQAVVFDRIPVGLWLHMSSNYMNQDFQQRLIWDPGLRKCLVDSLAKKGKP